MGIQFKTTPYAGHFPEIWRGDCKVLPGGFKPANTVAIGTVVRRATLLCVDFDAMSAAIVKTALVVAGGSTTAPRVAKGHYFAVGDVVAINGGASTATVKSVDATNSGYDVITFTSALTGVKADDVLIESSVATIPENGTAAPKYKPNACVSAEKEFKSTGINTLDAAYDALILVPSLSGTPVLPEWLNGFCLADNHAIKFIKQ